MRFAVGLALLASVLCPAAQSAQAGGPPNTADLVAKGKVVYTNNCVTCHGEKGDGTGPAGAYMNPKPRNFATDKFKNGSTPEQLFNTVTNGLDGTAMPGFSQLSETERWSVVYFVQTFLKK